MKTSLIKAAVISAITLLISAQSCDDSKTPSKTSSIEKAGKTMSFKEPVFTMHTGRLSQKDEGNIRKTCIIKGDNKAISANLVELAKQLASAKTQGMEEAVHFAPQIPSVEIIGHLYTPDKSGNMVKEDVLLLQDYSKIQTRKGADAKSLIDLVNKTCSDK